MTEPKTLSGDFVETKPVRWDNKTADEIIADLEAAVKMVVAATPDSVPPDAWFEVPIETYNQLVRRCKRDAQRTRRRARTRLRKRRGW